MKINMLSSFAAGILISTGIIGSVYFSNNSEKAVTSSSELPSEAKMKEELVKKGYVVLTQEEYQNVNVVSEAPESDSEGGNKESENKSTEDSESSSNEEASETTESANENQGNKPAEEPAENKSVEEKPVVEKPAEQAEPEEKSTEAVITVQSGMTSYDVGKMLIENNLIDMDAWAFAKDIESRGLAKGLQIGSYNVNSNMSYDEIVSAIFN